MSVFRDSHFAVKRNNTNISLESQRIDWFWSNEEEQTLVAAWRKYKNISACASILKRQEIEVHLHLLDLHLRRLIVLKEISVK